MADVNMADIASIQIDKAENAKNYFKQLFASLFNRSIVYSFDRLTISKQTARRIYMRAYPKAKV